MTELKTYRLSARNCTDAHFRATEADAGQVRAILAGYGKPGADLEVVEVPSAETVVTVSAPAPPRGGFF